MTTLAATVLAAVLAVFGLLTAPLERRLYRSEPGTAWKLFGYGSTIVLQWALTAAAVSICGWRLLLHSSAASWLPRPGITGPALGVAAAAYFVLAALPLLQSLRGARRRRAYAAAIRRGFAALPGLLPNTAAERVAWILVSLTAGICEELLYRGFLIRFLQDGTHLPVLGALVASSLLFGLGHVYQGFKGVVGTTVGGLSFGLLYLLSGSVIPGMILHVVIDMQMVFVLSPVSEEQAAATRPERLKAIHG